MHLWQPSSIIDATLQMESKLQDQGLEEARDPSLSFV